MNDEDLRDLFAGMALIGMMMHDDIANPRRAYVIADAMIDAKYAAPEVGITAIRKKRKTTKEEL